LGDEKGAVDAQFRKNLRKQIGGDKHRGPPSVDCISPQEEGDETGESQSPFVNQYKILTEGRGRGRLRSDSGWR